MNANTREVFQAVRRVYRSTRKGSYLVSNGLGPSVAAATALRVVTGKWDLCDPPSWNSWGEWVCTARGVHIRRPHVAAACTRWMRSTLP